MSSMEDGEERKALSLSWKALRESLQSIDGILVDLERNSQDIEGDNIRNTEVQVVSSRLTELETQNAALVSELKRLELEKESLHESYNSPVSEDYHFLVSDRVSLQSQLGDCQLRVKELESLLEDKNHEIEAKDAERLEFMERFQRYETEKINVLRQVISLERELENCKSELKQRSDEKNKAIDEYHDIHDVLKALREGKKVVETKLFKVIDEKNQGLLEVERQKGRIETLEESLAEKETQLAEKVSFYEDQMSGMQVEMNARLEEMNVNNDQTQESIRSRYVDLFEEKVQELFNLRSSYEESLSKLDSSERKRLELELELRDLQSQFTSKNEVNSGKITLLEKDLQVVKGQFESLKESCRVSVDQLRQRLRELRGELDAKNQELLEFMSNSCPAPQKVQQCSSSHTALNGIAQSPKSERNSSHLTFPLS